MEGGTQADKMKEHFEQRGGWTLAMQRLAKCRLADAVKSATESVWGSPGSATPCHSR